MVARSLTLALLVAAAPAAAQGLDGGTDNLLAGAVRVEERAASRAFDWLSDGVTAVEGSTWASQLAVQGVEAVSWDLGREVEVAGAWVQADAETRFEVQLSLDGADYRTVATTSLAKPGLRTQAFRLEAQRARFVRLRRLDGAEHAAVAEVGVVQQVPVPWPPPTLVRTGAFVRPQEVSEGQARSWGILVVVACAALILAARRARTGRARRAALGVAIALAAVAYTDFFSFRRGHFAHTWDQFHYFMGSKYFPELGFFDLYRCAAALEVDAAGAAAAEPIRDVIADRLDAAPPSALEQTRCAAALGPRVAEFREDLAAFKQALGTRLEHEALKDHGYNASPPLTWLLRLATVHLRPTPAVLDALGAVDLLCYALALVLLAWGFGLETAAVAALLWGGSPLWSFTWTGATLGRALWFAALCGGVAALQRKRPLLAGALLATASLLRVFPLFFLGSAIAFGLGRALKAPDARKLLKALLAGAVAVGALGAAVGCAPRGAGAWADFGKVLARHEASPLIIRVGLPVLFSFSANSTAARLAEPLASDPLETWGVRQRENAQARAPLRWAVALALFALVLCRARRGGDPVEAMVAGGALAFACVALSGYDFIWLAALAPAVRGPKGLVAVAASLLGVLFSMLFFPDLDVQFLLATLSVGALLAALWWQVTRPAPPA